MTAGKPDHPTPCPICHAPYGFHDEEPHNEAVARIPARLMRRSNTELKREASAARRAAYEVYRRRVAS